MSYTTPYLEDHDNYQHAFNVLEQLDGLTIDQTKRVLDTANQLLDQLNQSNCQSTQFQQAKTAFTNHFSE